MTNCASTALALVTFVFASACGSSGSSTLGDGGADGGGGSSGGSGGSGAQAGTAGSGGSSATGGAAGTGGTAVGGTGGGGGSCIGKPPPGAQPVECGAETCGADQICIYPCCGGPPPPCFPMTDAGECPPGTTPGLCLSDGVMGCQADPCKPAPPRCVDATSVQCPQCGDQCEAIGEGCFGDLDAEKRNLSCTCA